MNQQERYRMVADLYELKGRIAYEAGHSHDMSKVIDGLDFAIYSLLHPGSGLEMKVKSSFDKVVKE